ncbi:hypothetical protein O5O45_09075 [Hahella aquimaris]|uniref:hypothetical protein n=1 Tax=Hahella sp. HNIBRBA332 TaxID=3015983 RepID=UPI00273B51D4|nr:hypothetical protein [Hahella sp. HNIBRBA332]WLQ16065.1 hypothetical protein O5O45_09075 [Hahella sp. HNIBRBA332]
MMKLSKRTFTSALLSLLIVSAPTLACDEDHAGPQAGAPANIESVIKKLRNEGAIPESATYAEAEEAARQYLREKAHASAQSKKATEKTKSGINSGQPQYAPAPSPNNS